MSGSDILALRQRLGLSQSQLAKQLGCAKSTVVRWEMGQRPISNPYKQLITKLATEKS